MKFCTDIHGPQGQNPSWLCHPLDFSSSFTSRLSFCLWGHFSTTIGWIALKFFTDIHGSLLMYRSDFDCTALVLMEGEVSCVPPVFSSGDVSQWKYLSNCWMYCHEILYRHSWFPEAKPPWLLWSSDFSSSITSRLTFLFDSETSQPLLDVLQQNTVHSWSPRAKSSWLWWSLVISSSVTRWLIFFYEGKHPNCGIELPWNSVQTSMVPWWCTLLSLMIPLIYLRGVLTFGMRFLENYWTELQIWRSLTCQVFWFGALYLKKNNNIQHQLFSAC